MKITKLSLEVEMEKETERRAHDGCDRCPCCGMGDYIVSKLEPEIEISWYNGAPKKVMIDKYRCKLCGAEWQSDPFETKLDEYEIHRAYVEHESRRDTVITILVVAFFILFLLSATILVPFGAAKQNEDDMSYEQTKDVVSAELEIERKCAAVEEIITYKGGE